MRYHANKLQSGQTVFTRIFAHKPPLDTESSQWIFDIYSWAMRNLDPRVVRGQRILVAPTNELFPGREDSLHGMAGLIFTKVVEYAGMDHWPLRLSGPGEPQTMAGLQISASAGTTADTPNTTIALNYDPQLVGNPEGLIAHFAQALAHHLAMQSAEPPPGGVQNWPHLTEVLTVFMGFGLMTVNSAFNYRPRSCGGGGCSGTGAERQSFLSQYDLTYALALFCTLQDIPRREVLRHLKPSLRGFYKQSLKDVSMHEHELAGLGLAKQ